MQRFWWGLGAVITSAMVSSSLLALRAQPDKAPPVGSVDEKVKAQVQQGLQRSIKEVLNEFGDWAYPDAHFGAGSSGQLNSDCQLASNDTIDKVWAYYLDRLPKVKMRYPEHEGDALEDQPNSLKVPWGKRGYTYNSRYIYVSMPSAPRNHARIIYNEKTDIIFVTIAEVVPRPGNDDHTSIEIVKVKTIPPKSHIID